MAVIKAAAGGQVTIGSFAGGYPTRLTTGDNIRLVDPGTPLLNYFPMRATDPLKLWKTQPSLRKVVSFAARQIASVPWHAFQRVDDTDRQRRQQSPAERLMGRPAPLVTGYQLIRDLATDYMIYDLCCAVLADGELVRIPPSMISIKSDMLGRPREVWILTGNGNEDIEITDAPKVMTWGWHADKSGGVSAMHTLAAILNESLRAVEWRAQQWENSPKVSGIITRPLEAKAWKAEQRDRFNESWRRWRDNSSGGTPVLEDGMKYDALTGLTPKDAQDVVGRQLTDAEVASAFHIQPELVGARPGNFSNIDAFRQMLFGPTLGPLIQELQMAVNAGGLIESVDSTPGLYLEANREAAMAGSFMEQARVLQTMTGGPVMTRAEARARLNLPFIEGTDELVVPLNVTEGGQASPTDSGEQNVGGDNADPEAREDP